MIVLPKDFESTLTLINDNGVEAKIYTDPERLFAYKIYRYDFKFNQNKFDSFAYVTSPNCIKPLNPISIEGDDKIVGYNMEYIGGVSLPFLRDINISDLIKASLDIANFIDEVSAHQFMIWDGNAQNIMFDGSFKFVDTYTYTHIKNGIRSILFKWNIRFVNEICLRGIIGFSYKKLLAKYLTIVSPHNYKLFRRLNPSNEMFVYDVLSILQDASSQNSLDEAKLKMLVPTSKSL